jgi:hypothetical protein
MDAATKAERRAARERVSAYSEAELAKLIERVEQAIARYRSGEIDIHDVDDVIRRYSRAARELSTFCWSQEPDRMLMARRLAEGLAGMSALGDNAVTTL